MNKEVKNDNELLKHLRDILRKNYEKILIAYKYLASQLGTSIPQIGESSLLDFINNCPNLLNSKFLINDVLIQASTVKGAEIDERVKMKNKNFPNNIIRHQFLLLLVKISTSQNVITNNCNKIFNIQYNTLVKLQNTSSIVIESVKNAFSNYYPAALNKYPNPHDWRIERYYNEYVDNFLKAFIPILEAVFRSYATKKDPSKRE